MVCQSQKNRGEDNNEVDGHYRADNAFEQEWGDVFGEEKR